MYWRLAKRRVCDHVSTRPRGSAPRYRTAVFTRLPTFSYTKLLTSRSTGSPPGVPASTNRRTNPRSVVSTWASAARSTQSSASTTLRYSPRAWSRPVLIADPCPPLALRSTCTSPGYRSA